MPAIETLMKSSIADLFPAFYDDAQTKASIEYVGVPDPDLIEDGTYYVAEIDGEIIACGGWSKRKKLYTGSVESDEDHGYVDPATGPAHVRAMFVRADWTRRGLGRAILERSERDAKADGFTTMSLMATLPGEQLYAAYGFSEVERTEVEMPDGTMLACVDMVRPITL